MPERITLSRAPGYRRPEGTIQVDRATIFGNPWQVGDPGWWWLPHGDGTLAKWEIAYDFGFPIDAAAAVDFYSTWIRSGNLPLMPDCLTPAGRAHMREVMGRRRSLILTRLPSLRGHPLGCRCKQDQPCHAVVLIDLANGVAA
jgi:Domain of unknown function (DUF4326)